MRLGALAASLIGCALLASPPAAAPARAGDRVYATAAEVEPLQPGSRVPSASVTSVKGETVDLAELVRERGALLVFYRGGW